MSASNRDGEGRQPSGARVVSGPPRRHGQQPCDDGASLACFLSREDLVARLIEFRRLGVSPVRWQSERLSVEVAMRRAALLRGDESVVLHAQRIYIGRPAAAPTDRSSVGVVLQFARCSAPAAAARE